MAPCASRLCGVGERSPKGPCTQIVNTLKFGLKVWTLRVRVGMLTVTVPAGSCGSFLRHFPGLALEI